MTRALTVGQLAAAIEARSRGRLPVEVRGDAALPVTRVAPLESADGSALAFLANPRYRGAVLTTRAAAVLLTAADAEALGARPDGPCWLVCAQPYAAFAFASQTLQPDDEAPPGVAVGAVVAADATVAPDAAIGPGAFVGAGARIGPGSRLGPGARVLAGCELGARCIVHPGAVIGADGFGFAPFEGRWLKIPQTGRVLVGDDVEIGANTTIDRGTMGDTVVEEGVKLDNQIQIGHNCRIGAHTVIAGCVGIAGSTTVGRGCQIGGAAMVLGHLKIADGTVISAGTLVSRSITEPGFYTGFFPLMKNRDWERNAAVLRQLDGLRERVRALEAELKSRPRDPHDP